MTAAILFAAVFSVICSRSPLCSWLRLHIHPLVCPHREVSCHSRRARAYHHFCVICYIFSSFRKARSGQRKDVENVCRTLQKASGRVTEGCWCQVGAEARESSFHQKSPLPRHSEVAGSVSSGLERLGVNPAPTVGALPVPSGFSFLFGKMGGLHRGAVLGIS